MNEITKSFNDYMNEYKKLTLEEKRSEMLRSIKEFIAIFEQMAKIENISFEYISSREILDLKTSNSEDDFLEASMVYIENAKNIVGQYIDKKNI